MFILENVSIVVTTSVVVLLLCPSCARATFFHAGSYTVVPRSVGEQLIHAESSCCF